MAVTIGDYEAILSGGIGDSDLSAAEITEVLTRGHWDGLSATNLLPMTGVEVLYPIAYIPRANKITFRQDKMTWKVTTKSSAAWRHEINTISFRVRKTNFSAFLSFLRNNKHQIVILNIPGVKPFIRADETNDVYILDIGNPQLEKPFHYKISVTFLRDPSA